MIIGQKTFIATICLFLVVTICSGLVGEACGQSVRGNRGKPEGKGLVFLTEVPEYKANIILGRPTGTSITLSVLCDSDTEAIIAYGTKVNQLFTRTEIKSFRKGQPQEIILEKLKPDTRYYYQLLDVKTKNTLVEGAFHTQRTSGNTFAFTITADSHLDQNTDLNLYQRTLANVLADVPDFHIDLGDTFMTDKHENREKAARQYLAQRFYFGQLCRAVPLFLVLGNHDGEDSKLLRGGADSLAVWSNMMRKQYFPNPFPDSFYTGNTKRDPLAGQLQDYYAWQWGDALFVVLNPYWQAMGRRSNDSWDRTLGDEQYKWLKRTLENSRARFKFVFVHQLVGGLDKQGRGGTEAASFGEWGGKNPDGTDGFKDYRPGWDMPIHQLLVHNHVTIVFHGHDHFFAKQDLDGIVYQEVPQPGFPRSGSHRAAAEYGYHDGVILGGSGHILVTVVSDKVTAYYVLAQVNKEGHVSPMNRQVSHSYSIKQ